MSDAPKTVPTDADVQAFVAAVEHPVRRRDAERLLAIFEELTGQKPVMWGPSIIGFGSYHYRYASGREGDMAAAGFSPRKAATVLYVTDGAESHPELFEQLGPHRRTNACVYVKNLDEIDLEVLREIIKRSYDIVTAGTFGTRLSGPDAGNPAPGTTGWKG